jgi:hypothetical protein
MAIIRKVGDATKAPADRFAGDVWMWPRLGATQHTEVRACWPAVVVTLAVTARMRSAMLQLFVFLK